jgi:hypothetical protein
MKILVLALALFTQSAMAAPDKCHRSIAYDFRSQYENINIESIDYLREYEAGTEFEAVGTKVSFDQSGFLYQVTSEYYSGTGITVYLVSASCKVLDKAAVYEE